MKPTVINMNSWHYRLTSRRFRSDVNWHLYHKLVPNIDLCTYMRSVAWGLLWRFILGGVVALFGVGLIHLGLALWFWIEPEFWAVFAIFPLGAVALVAFAAGMAWVFNHAVFPLLEIGVETVASFVELAGRWYEGFKGRYCPVVKIEKE